MLADDVLSALDSHTTSYIFTNCLKGKLMRHRTCVLVTHAVETVMPGAAFVVALDNGTVVASGPPNATHLPTQLVAKLAAEDNDASDALASAMSIGVDATANVLDGQAAEDKRARNEKAKLVNEETQATGQSPVILYS